MARFKASAAAATLQLQLSTSALTPAEVVGYSAYGQTTTGSTTRPAFTRPVTGGTPSEVSRANSLTPSTNPQTGAYATFSVAPSTPTGLSSGSYNLPLNLRWEAARSRGIIIPVSAFGLLYAAATGGHSWLGEVIWEER